VAIATEAPLSALRWMAVLARQRGLVARDLEAERGEPTLRTTQRGRGSYDTGRREQPQADRQRKSP
jgi:hypothetical protein